MCVNNAITCLVFSTFFTGSGGGDGSCSSGSASSGRVDKQNHHQAQHQQHQNHAHRNPHGRDSDHSPVAHADRAPIQMSLSLAVGASLQQQHHQPDCTGMDVCSVGGGGGGDGGCGNGSRSDRNSNGYGVGDKCRRFSNLYFKKCQKTFKQFVLSHNWSDIVDELLYSADVIEPTPQDLIVSNYKKVQSLYIRRSSVDGGNGGAGGNGEGDEAVSSSSSSTSSSSASAGTRLLHQQGCESGRISTMELKRLIQREVGQCNINRETLQYVNCALTNYIQTFAISLIMASLRMGHKTITVATYENFLEYTSDNKMSLQDMFLCNNVHEYNVLSIRKIELIILRSLMSLVNEKVVDTAHPEKVRMSGFLKLACHIDMTDEFLQVIRVHAFKFIKTLGVLLKRHNMQSIRVPQIVDIFERHVNVFKLQRFIKFDFDSDEINYDTDYETVAN